MITKVWWLSCTAQLLDCEAVRLLKELHGMVEVEIDTHLLSKHKEALRRYIDERLPHGFVYIDGFPAEQVLCAFMDGSPFGVISRLCNGIVIYHYCLRDEVVALDSRDGNLKIERTVISILNEAWTKNQIRSLIDATCSP